MTEDTRVCEADLSDPVHQRAIVDLIDQYAQEAPGGQPLSAAVRDRLAAIKVFYERLTLQEGGEADQFPGPAVYLPEKKPDLAKVVDLREAKDGNESDG